MLPILLLLAGCGDPGCLSGEDGCLVPSPCPELSYTCDDGWSELRVIGPDEPLPGGMDALASPGDVILGNERVVAVIDALDHPHYISPTGGMIVDLVNRDRDDDSLRHLFQAVGLLPGEAIAYDELELLDEGEVKAVQVKGSLVGFPDVVVATRYEVRPCEPGIRIRTEVYNGALDTLSWFLTDAWYWGGRENLAFTPSPGSGFDHPSFGLGDILTAFREVPYLVAGFHAEPAATYSTLACDAETAHGFQSEEISTIGRPVRPVPPRDYEVFERFVGVTPGPGVSAGADLAMELREKLWGEAWVTLTGQVTAPGGTLGESVRAALTIAEGTADTPAEERIPWTHVVPGADGRFSARVPAGREYVVVAEAFGREQGVWEVDARSGDVDVGTLQLPGVGEVTLYTTVDGVDDHALVFVVPADDATHEATRGTYFGHFPECAPLLGNPHGPSPACNRVLVDGGPTTIALPPGNYDFYAVAGPFTTLGAQRGVRVSAEAGQSVSLAVRTLPLQPEGTLTADFHVHGGPSFDSNFPDEDRVRAFLASRIQVIATTEHDVVHDYADAIDALGAADRLRVMTGTESTGHILFQFRSDYAFPQVVGHWNFWPMAYDPQGPWRGSAWDELAEPGLLFTRQEDQGFDPATGVIELNHPLGGAQFGRDYSWGSAAGFDLTRPLETGYDGSGQSLFFHTPEGARWSNADYHVQEVMNGTNNGNLLQYRAFWFWLLDQGIVRGGTANSDSHTLTENVLGTPRNVVWTDTTFEDFDPGEFNASVKAGTVMGTNGPVVVAWVDNAGAVVWPGVAPFVPEAGAVLHVEVDAAPWVPVDEVRVIVNGSTYTETASITHPSDPFGDEGTHRLSFAAPLADFLPESGDAWIVVEAGTALEPNEDLNCDGIPDTGDNNRDGVIDWRDVEDLEEDPGEDCFETVGPLTEPAPPERETALWYFRTVTPDGYPAAFTNPLLVDRDGDGFEGVSR